MTELEALAFVVFAAATMAVILGVVYLALRLLFRFMGWHWEQPRRSRRPETPDERVERKRRNQRELQRLVESWRGTGPERERREEESRAFQERLDRLFALPPEVARRRAERLLGDPARFPCSRSGARGQPLPTALAPRLREFFAEHGDVEVPYTPEPGPDRTALGPGLFQILNELPDHIIIGGEFNEVQARTYLARAGEETIWEYMEGWLPDERFDREVDELLVAAPSIDHLILVLDPGFCEVDDERSEPNGG